MNYIKVQLYLK